MQTRAGQDVDPAVEKFFEILAKPHDVQQRTVRIHVHQEVDVAVLAVFGFPTGPISDISRTKPRAS